MHSQKMIAGLLKLDIKLLENPGNLKEKRRIIKGLLGRLKTHYEVSASEVGSCDLWQRAVIGFSCISNEKHVCESIITKIFNYIDNDPSFEIINHKIEYIFF